MRQQLPPGIKKVELGSRENGRPKVRYEIVIDVGIVNGRRKQIRRRKTEDGQPITTEALARSEYAKLLASVKTGSYVHKRGTTIKEVVEQWVSGQTGLRPSSSNSDADRLKHFVTLYGDMPIQDLKKHHLDTLMEKLKGGEVVRANGKKCRPHNGLSRRNVLSAIKKVLASEVEQGHLPRNVAQFVQPPALDSEERQTLTVEQLQKVFALTADERLGHLPQLGSLGLRKAELAGLMWEHIDMDAHSMKITKTRVVSGGKVHVGKPKTDRSNRDLPIPDPVYTALLHARAVQAREKLEAGDKYVDSGYVFVDELGREYYPDFLTDSWMDACKRAGVPVIVLHDERHTCATLMLLNGVPHVVVSAWLGHANPAITLRIYAHLQPQALDDAAASYAKLVTTPVTENEKAS